MSDSVRDSRIGDSDSPEPQTNPAAVPGVVASMATPTITTRLNVLGEGKGDLLSDVAEELTIIKGSASVFKVLLQGDNDEDLNVSDVDAAKLTIRTHVGATEAVLEYDLDDTELVLTDSELRVHPNQTDADALEADEYIAQVALHFDTPDEWRYSKYFRVRVIPNMFVAPEA